MPSLLEQVHPSIAQEYTAENLRRDPKVPASLLFVYADPEDIPNEAFNQATYIAGGQATIAEVCRERAATCRDALGKDISDTPANRMALIAQAARLEDSADSESHPEFGCPGHPAHILIVWLKMVSQERLKVAKAKYPKDLSRQREVIIKTVKQLNEELKQLYIFFFEQEQFGKRSLGWKSAGQRKDFLKELEKLANAEGFIKEIREAFIATGGKPSSFKKLENNWQSTIAEWLPRFAAQEAPESPLPLGEGGLNIFLKRWGFKTEIRDLLGIFERNKMAIQAEQARRDSIETDKKPTAEPLGDAKSLLERVLRVTRHFKAFFLDSGLLPATQKPFELDSETVQVEEGGASSFFAKASGGKVIFNLERAQESPADLAAMVAHECIRLLHSGKNGYWEKAILAWRNSFGEAGGAKVTQWVYLDQEAQAAQTAEERQASFAHVSAALDLDYTINVRASALIRFHLGEITWNEAAQEYAKSFGKDADGNPLMDINTAKDRLARGAAEPWSLIQYALGSQIFAQILEANGGDLAATYKEIAAKTHLLLPAHLAEEDFIFGEYEVKAATPITVGLSSKYCTEAYLQAA